MIPKLKKRLSILLLLLLFSMMNCTKDSMVPDSKLENLFGSWKWVQSSGGIAGQTEIAATAGYTKSIEFNKNGVFKSYKNGNQNGVLNFQLSEVNSIVSNEKVFLIKYYLANPINNNQVLNTQSIKFSSNDSLFLYDECFDCYSHVYIKQK